MILVRFCGLNKKGKVNLLFFDIFKELCKKNRISVSAAAAEIGLSNSTPTKWKKTGATPDGNTLSKIASYFGVPTDYLLGKSAERIHYEDLDDMYHHAIVSWSENKFLPDELQTQTKMHYSELLLRYKALLERLSYSVMSIEDHFQSGKADENANATSLSRQKIIENLLRQDLEDSLTQLKRWVDTAPLYFSLAMDKNLAVREVQSDADTNGVAETEEERLKRYEREARAEADEIYEEILQEKLAADATEAFGRSSGGMSA